MKRNIYLKETNRCIGSEIGTTVTAVRDFLVSTSFRYDVQHCLTCSPGQSKKWTNATWWRRSAQSSRNSSSRTSPHPSTTPTRARKRVRDKWRFHRSLSCRPAISRRCSPPIQSSNLSVTTCSASTFCTAWSAWKTSPPWIRVVLATEPTTSRSVLYFMFVRFSHAILRANALTIRSPSWQRSLTCGYPHIRLGAARQSAARAHREAVWRDYDGPAMVIGYGQSHTRRSDRIWAARRRCDSIDAAGSDPNRWLSLSVGHQRQVPSGVGPSGGMGLHVRRRNRVGEVQSESTPGEEPRVLSSALEGNVFGGEKGEDWKGLRCIGKSATADELWVWTRCDLFGATGAESEATRHLRDDRAVSAERILFGSVWKAQ